MLQASTLFLDDLLFGMGDRRFESLLTSSRGFANAGLAKLYGVAPPAGAAPAPVTLPATERAGILTQLGFLVASGSTPLATPIKRGRFLYERLATCNPVPPPEGQIPEPPPARDGAPVREQLGQHSANGVCRACHSLMDPIGFAFLGYDTLGRFRTKDERGNALDATGVLPGLGSGELRFDGAVRRAFGASRANAAISASKRAPSPVRTIS